jgi:hypothetical protein
MDHSPFDSSFRASGQLEKTFLTEGKSKDPDSFERINEYYKELREQVAKLDIHIDNVLHKHENDFLNAFKCQMFTLYSQLKELKKKSDENELKLKRDEQLNKLQTSLDWFREEALQLGEKTHSYKKEAEKWKAKAESLEDDRRFLEEQLKAAKKRIKDLEEAKNKLAVEATSRSKSTSSYGRRFVPSTKGGIFIFDLIQKAQGKTAEVFYEIEKYLKNIEERYEDRIAKVKFDLKEEKKRILSVSVQKSSDYFEKSELEALFLECVDEVRKDVIKRRTQNLFTQKFQKKSVSPARPDRNALTSSDRRKILELLVSNEKVLILIFEKLFPHKSLSYLRGSRTEEDANETSGNFEDLLKQVPVGGSSFSPSKSRLFTYS